MAVGHAQVSDIIVPSSFARYVMLRTEEKSRLIASGMLQRNPLLEQFLAGGGLTTNLPAFRDLDNDADNVSTDSMADRIAATIAGAFPNPGLDSQPFDIGAVQEIAVRLSRNASWSSSDLAAALAGEDPVEAIADRVADYWARRLQQAFVATWQGVCKDNGTNDAGDYTNDVAAAAFAAGVTNFTAENFLDATLTMGDSMEGLVGVMMHSVVYNRAQKNNLIEFIPDARGETDIPTFLGKQVIVDDGLPNGANAVRGDGAAGAAGVFETWLFGTGATQFGAGIPKVPVATERDESAGNGGGQETLFSRTEWAIHPVGHAYTGTAPNGGPGNGTAANDLNNATSWNRVYPERKQIPFAKLVTRES